MSLQADPCSIRIQLQNRMEDFVCVTHVVIDVEKLDKTTVAFIEDAVDREVPRLIVRDTKDTRYPDCTLIEDEYSIANLQKKKREASGELRASAATSTQATISSTDSFANMKRLHTLTCIEKEKVEGWLNESLKKLKEANVQLKKDWESEKKQANILWTEREKAHIQEKETMVICFCKAPYCFG